MRYAIWVALTLLHIGFVAHAFAADRVIDGVPIPSDAKVSSPSRSAPDGHRNFSGSWIGAWGGGLKHILIVESVSPDGQTSVVYAWGDNPALKINRGWRRFIGTIIGETLTVGADFKAEYKLSSAGVATASWQRGEERAQATMKKVEPAALNAASPRIAWGTYQSLMLDTSLHEDGKAIRLEVVISKPAGSGPFPLAILNHGSTGRGDKPELFKHTFTMPALAQYLVDKNWLVAFPQRRGRGKSEGRYDEGFEADRSRYACEARLSLPGAERALLDIEAAIEALRERSDIQSGPILIGGVSRGGILSLVYAGKHPDHVQGVINFVGGWLGSQCSFAVQVNGDLFRRGARYRHLLLGRSDRDYEAQGRSRGNQHAGGNA